MRRRGPTSLARNNVPTLFSGTAYLACTWERDSTQNMVIGQQQQQLPHRQVTSRMDGRTDRKGWFAGGSQFSSIGRLWLPYNQNRLRVVVAPTTLFFCNHRVRVRATTEEMTVLLQQRRNDIGRDGLVVRLLFAAVSSKQQRDDSLCFELLVSRHEACSSRSLPNPSVHLEVRSIPCFLWRTLFVGVGFCLTKEVRKDPKRKKIVITYPINYPLRTMALPQSILSPINNHYYPQ